MSTAAQKTKLSAASTINDEDDDDFSSDFPSPSRINDYTGAKKAQAGKARDSLSSVSTLNDYNESSGYSTPLTSGAATPASFAKSTTSTGRRGRPRATMAASAPTPSVNLVARAAALRNSQYSLNPNKRNKRKRISDSDDDEDADDDNTADAQLAWALQEQENEKANTMSAMDVDGPSLRRTPRKSQKIRPKIDYASDLSDDENDFVPIRSSGPVKTPKVELSSKGTNAVTFKGKGKAITIQDSDDSEDIIEIEDSEDSDAPIAMTTPRTRMKQVVQGQSKAFKAGPSSRGRPKTMALPASTSRRSKPPARSAQVPAMKREDTKNSTTSGLTSLASDTDFDSSEDSESSYSSDDSDRPIASSSVNRVPSGIVPSRPVPATVAAPGRRGRGNTRQRVNLAEHRGHGEGRAKKERARLEGQHPELLTMWKDLENLPKIDSVKIEQPKNINRELKPFQLEGVAWMKAMEKTDWGGGLLGDEMGMGKTIQAVSLIMSDFPAAQPSLVLIPPVALMQWQQEIAAYTDGTLKTFVYHGTNAHTKGATVEDLKKYHVILMSYNSLESMYRKQEKGFKRKKAPDGIYKEESIIHQIHFHRVILDEAHNIKVSVLLLVFGHKSNGQ